MHCRKRVGCCFDPVTHVTRRYSGRPTARIVVYHPNHRRGPPAPVSISVFIPILALLPMPHPVLLIHQINLGCLVKKRRKTMYYACKKEIKIKLNVGSASTDGLNNEQDPRIFPLIAISFSCKVFSKYQVKNTMCFVVWVNTKKHTSHKSEHNAFCCLHQMKTM